MMLFTIRSFHALGHRRLHISSNLQRYATTTTGKATKFKPTARIPRSSPVPSTRSIPSSITTSSEQLLSPAEALKQHSANKLYENGVRSLYKAPSHVGVLGISWLLGFTFVGMTAALGWLGHWKSEENKELSNMQAMVVGVGTRIGMIFFTCVGVVAVLRYKNLITSLDLVQQYGTTNMKVVVRRTVPFLKPKQYIVPTYDFRLPYKYMPPIEDPSEATGKSSSNLNPLTIISKAMFVPFKWFRTYIFRDGVMRVKFDNADKTALLDERGWWSNDAKDFFDITTTDKPWDA